MPPMSAEATVSRNYIDWLLERAVERKVAGLDGKNQDLEFAAQKMLDEDHYSLEKIKERIIEHPRRACGWSKRSEGIDSVLRRDLRGSARLPSASRLAALLGRKFVQCYR